jgi:replicative DNA helicase
MPARDAAKEAEYNVIGAILLDNKAYYCVAELEPGDFQDPQNRKAYVGIREILAEDKSVDVFTLCDHTGLGRLRRKRDGCAARTQTA